MLSSIVRLGRAAQCRGDVMRLSRGLLSTEVTRHSKKPIYQDTDTGDQFGSLSESWNDKVANTYQFVKDDEDEQERHESKVADIYRPGKSDFMRKIENLIQKKDLRSALEVLETEMRQELVQPEEEHYRALIHACAVAGNTRKAFQLYREFKDRLKAPKQNGMYADLFLACTKCHDRELGLRKAKGLLGELREKHINPNKVIYNTMIQAFGRNGDLVTALNLLDEMKMFKFKLDSESYNFLLQGCLSDKVNGFRHAIMIWRNMRRKKITPSIYTYNLMLRCTRECGLGNPELLQDILLESLTNKERKALQAKQETFLESQTQEKPGDQENKMVMLDGVHQNWWEVDIEQLQREQIHGPEIPSLLEVKPNLSRVLKLNLQDTSQDRLMLLGSVEQIVKCMLADGIQPEIKTFSILLNCANTPEMETAVLDSMRHLGIKPDTGFFNQIIKNRAFRHDNKLGISTLEEMQNHAVVPDIITFGCLALCCEDMKSSLKLLKNLHEFGARPNMEIMGGLINGAIRRLAPAEVRLLLEICENEKVSLDAKNLEKIEKFYQDFRNFIMQKERGMRVPYPVILEMKKDYKNWLEFKEFYSSWLSRIQVDLNTDPTLQYKTSRDLMLEKKRLEKLESDNAPAARDSDKPEKVQRRDIKAKQRHDNRKWKRSAGSED